MSKIPVAGDVPLTGHGHARWSRSKSYATRSCLVELPGLATSRPPTRPLGIPDIVAVVVTATREAVTLDDLTPGVQQDSVGVGLRSEHAVAVVEVVGERL